MPWDSVEKKPWSCALRVSSPSQAGWAVHAATICWSSYFTAVCSSAFLYYKAALFFRLFCCLHHFLGCRFQPAKPCPCLLTSPAEIPRPETPASQPCAKLPNKLDESGLVAIWRSIAARAQTCISVSILNHAASLAWQPVRITHSLDGCNAWLFDRIHYVIARSQP